MDCLRYAIGTATAVLMLGLAGCNDDDPGPGPMEPEPPEGPTITVVATGLRFPTGIELDDQGRIWVAEEGTGPMESRISVITPDGEVHTVIDGLASNFVQGSPQGVHHLVLRDGEIWATQGLGEESPEGNLLRIDVSGFTPGDPPLTMADVVVEDVGTFVLAADPTGTAQTNIYDLVFGPSGDLFITDASANAVLRREADTGALSVLAVLPPVPNDTGVGPPMMEPVPTGIVFEGGRLLVTAFPGFPFPDGAARVYAVDLAGNVSVFQDGLTGAVDLTLDTAGRPVVLQHARGFQADFLPLTGSVVRLLSGGATETLVEELLYPAGIHFAPNGDFYVTEQIPEGILLRVTP
ncbi:MAG: ScyD/ScyE family protein [Gemmatimonadota bacterium]